MGYIGTRMSENAFLAYQNEEKPLSKWSKGELLELLSADLAEKAKKLNLGELRSALLYKTAWHHTGKFFAETDFWAVDENELDEFDEQKIEGILARRVKKERKPKAKPLFVTAKIEFVEWVGRFVNHKRPVNRVCVVRFMSNDKQVATPFGTKRLSSVKILKQVEQKTKFADDKKVL